MDQQSIYGINDLSGFQPGPSQVDNDISMSVDPEGQLPPEFDGLSMDIGANSLIDGVQKSYTPLNTGTSHRTIAASTSAVSIPLSGDVPASLPADFAAQSAGPVPSTQAEFKKRKNIEPQIVEELEDFLHILTPDGRIVYLSPSGKDLTGYPQDELLGKFILDFIHPDDSGIFMRDFNESITSGKPIQLFYRFRKRDGTYTIFECRGHPQFSSDAAAFRLNNAAGVCEGYFMMARPYPTKNAALLDSFLEQKIEHERLTKRINDLKREEAEDAEEEQRQWQRKQGRRSDMPHEDINTIGGTSATIPTSPRLLSPNAKVMLLPTPSMPIHSGATRSNAEDGAANRHPDSIDGNVARYDDVTHVETIEMFTGLRYQDGERSRGISTGDQSPTLVRGDAGIAIPINKEQKGTDKKKKIKLPEEYVCTDCGTLDSPEWRKGPSGPKTLCNACGLRWAKKEKRKSFSAPVPLMVYSGPK